MRNVEHWVKSVDKSDVLRVYRYTGSLNTINQFLSPFYILLKGILGVRYTLQGGPTQAILDTTHKTRLRLTNHQMGFDYLEITLHKGDVVVIDQNTGLLHSVICSKTPYRDVLFGLGYTYYAEESRDGTHTANSTSEKYANKFDQESHIHQLWWDKHGEAYTKGTLQIKIEKGSVYVTANHEKIEEFKFLYSDPDPVLVPVDTKVVQPTDFGIVDDTPKPVINKGLEGVERDNFILDNIKLAAKGNITDAINCYTQLHVWYKVTPEEFMAKVKFLDLNIWQRLKFWFARN